MLYEIKLRVTKEDSEGVTKEVKEHYIMDTNLHAEAEKLGYLLYEGTDVDVFAVFRSDIKEIVNYPQDGKYAYKATIKYVFVDDSGKGKEIKCSMLLWADDINSAVLTMNKYLKQGYDVTLEGMRRIKILDILAEGEE